jgi:CBS domain
MPNDFRMQDLSGLDQGLRVRHIANSPLITCRESDDVQACFSLPENKEFDQLPIRRGKKIVAIAERSNPNLRPLDDSVLVAADSPLSSFIRTVHKQPYRLVVDGTAINGIVTWSDLLKLPVTVLAFSLIAQLELAMNSRIREKYGNGDDWLRLLNRKERAEINHRKENLSRQNLVLADLELEIWLTKRRFFEIETTWRT